MSKKLKNQKSTNPSFSKRLNVVNLVGQQISLDSLPSCCEMPKLLHWNFLSKFLHFCILSRANYEFKSTLL